MGRFSRQALFKLYYSVPGGSLHSALRIDFRAVHRPDSLQRVASWSFSTDKGDTMRKSLTALAAATTLAVVAVATPTTADARCGWWGPAIIGSALARPYYAYPFRYGYGPYYGYVPAYYGYYGPGYYPYYARRCPL